MLHHEKWKDDQTFSWSHLRHNICVDSEWHWKDQVSSLMRKRRERRREGKREREERGEVGERERRIENRSAIIFLNGYSFLSSDPSQKVHYMVQLYLKK